MSDFEVDGLQFLPSGGLAITFMELPTDVRVQGQVVMQRHVTLAPSHPDYADDIDLLRRQVVKVLRNALEDFHNSEPYDPRNDDEDDDRGLGE